MKNKLNFSMLSGSILYAFGQKCLSLFDPAKISNPMLQALFRTVHQALTNFGKGFEYDSKDPNTPIIEQKDALRDRYYNGLKSYIRTFLYSDLQEQVDAAGKLLAVMRRHGMQVTRMNLDEETTAITSLISELREKWVPETSLLDTTEWIEKLDQAQNGFNEAVKVRNQQGSRELPTITQYRPEVIRSLKSWFSALELQHEVSPDPLVKDLLDQIDDLIGRTMATAKAGSTRRENRNGEETEGSNPPASDPVS